MKLGNFKVLTFDCYGTLIDWESGIWNAFQPLLREQSTAIEASDLLLRFAHHEFEAEQTNPDLLYPALLARVHLNISDELGVETSSSMNENFGHSVPDWPAFDDSVEALARLQTRYKLVVLSNVDRVSFAASQQRLGVEFDAVYTAQDIGSYKPSPENFRYLLEHLKSDLNASSEHVLHVAQSLRHDHEPARAAGLANVWIGRQRLSQGGAWGATLAFEEIPHVDYTFFSLADFAEAVENDV